MRGGRGTAALAGVLVLAGCGGSPTAPRRSCRIYATGLTRNGAPGACAFDGRTYRCRFGFDERAWSYDGAADFIQEARTVNLVRARSRTSSGGGPMLLSFGSQETLYTYDGTGRFLERRRTAANSFGSWTVDATRYDRWDGLGRPTGGEITSSTGTEPVSIAYDDASRTAETSNGELTVRSPNGDIVREAEFPGSPIQEYAFTATAEVCE